MTGMGDENGWMRQFGAGRWGGGLGKNPLTRHAIRSDKYDDYMWNELMEESPTIRESVRDAEQKLETAEMLFADVRSSLFQDAPLENEASEMQPLYRPHKPLISEMMSMPEWESLRASGTVYDNLSASVGTCALTPKLIELIDKAAQEAMNQAAEAERRAQEAQEKAERNPGDQRAQQKAQQARDDADQAAERAEQAVQRQIDHNGPRMREGIRQAIAEAKGEVKGTGEALSSFGGGTPGGGFSPTGQGANLDARGVDEKMRLAQAIRQSEKLRELAALAGHVAKTVRKVQQAKKIRPVEVGNVHGTVRGNDLDKVLPSEYALLGHKDTVPLFYKHLVAGTLRQVEREGREKGKRGPIILCVDVSGSMDEPLGSHSREVHAKAVMLGLLMVAAKQRRDLVVVYFSGRSTPTAEFRFDKGKVASETLIACCEHFPAGGTSYEAWMTRATQLLDESVYRKADVIVVSDGQAYVDEQTTAEFKRALSRKGATCLAVLIGERDEDGRGVLAQLSEKLFSVMDMEGMERASEGVLAV